MNPIEIRPTAPESTSLLAVIDQSERIQDTVEECAADLTRVNEVMKAHLATPTPDSEVAAVLCKSESIEAKVQSAADELTQVNEALAAEVHERAVLEAELQGAQRREARALDAALHDPLTRLANRALFDDRLEVGLAQAKRHGRHLTVLFMDLDGFKAINDTHGHEAGDQVLAAIAGRLRGMTRAEDTVSRYGGDEFVCLLPEPSSEEAVARVARKIFDGVCEPIRLSGGDDVTVRCSIGVAIGPGDGETGAALIQVADRAMYRAKQKGGGVEFVDRRAVCGA